MKRELSDTSFSTSFSEGTPAFAMRSGRREPSLIHTTVALPDSAYDVKIILSTNMIITGVGEQCYRGESLKVCIAPLSIIKHANSAPTPCNM